MIQKLQLKPSQQINKSHLVTEQGCESIKTSFAIFLPIIYESSSSMATPMLEILTHDARNTDTDDCTFKNAISSEGNPNRKIYYISKLSTTLLFFSMLI